MQRRKHVVVAAGFYTGLTACCSLGESELKQLVDIYFISALNSTGHDAMTIVI